MRSPSFPRVILKPVVNFPTYTYSFAKDIKVNIISMDGKTTFNESRRVILVNKQDNVVMNK